MTQTMECPHACIRCTACDDSAAAKELRALRAQAAERAEALERLRGIVDEQVGLQAGAGWDELLDLIEERLSSHRRERFVLREAVHWLHLHMPPDKLVNASPCTLEAIGKVAS